MLPHHYQPMKKLLLLCLLSHLSTFTFAQTLQQQWATPFAGSGENSDKFNDFILDGTGNVYAVGFTYRQGNGKDFLLVKFNAAGDTVFTRTYDGTGNGNDELEALVFDNSGNIVVCGTSKTLTGKDITTAKYDASGNQLWVSTYNGFAHLDDYGVDVVTDASGNIYAGGYGYNAQLNNDFIVVKYNAAGIQQNVGLFDGAENLDDVLNDLAIDAAGNIIATGQSRTSGSRDDYATAKWNSSLIQQWAVTLDNAAKTDRAKSLYTDVFNDIYITGRSDNGNDDDFVTQKLNSSDGTQIWIKIFDSNGEDQATSIAGNDSLVIVTGTRFNGLQKDIQTIAYTKSNGAILWSKTYGNVNGKNENANHVCIGVNGIIAVTGTTNVSATGVEDDDVLILEYDLAGNQQGATITGGNWGKNDDGEKSIVDASGNIYTIGSIANNNSMKDAWIYKQDVGGTALLNKHYNGQGEFTDKAIAITESSGSIYTTGYTNNYNEDRNFCTIKYDGAGNIVWQKTFNGPDSDTDEPADIAADGSGNVYVAGRSKNANNDYDMFVIKYNSNGDTIWTENYDNGLFADEEVTDIAINAAGDVYLTGVADNDASLLTNNDFVTIKISAAGAFQWASFFNGSGSADDKAYSITLDNSGNAFVTGKTWNGTDYDIQIAKYDAVNGSETLFASYTSNLGDDVPEKILLDNTSNVIVAGTSDRDASASTNRDFLVVKYNSSGMQQWAQTYNGAGTGDDDLKDMGLDGLGNIFVTGQSDIDSSSSDNLDYATIKFSASGNCDWVANYNGGMDDDDISNSIALLSNGDICVTGQSAESFSGVTNKNATSIIYSSSGAALDFATYDGMISGTDEGEAILYHNGSIFVSGYGTYTTAGQKDLLTIKYALTVGIRESQNDLSLLVYPNPSNSGFTVCSSLFTEESSAKLTLTDATGREITSARPTTSNYKLQTSNLNSGVYFLRIQSGSHFSETKIVVQ